MGVEGVCQGKAIKPCDGQRPPIRQFHTHTGPALYPELRQHRRKSSAIAEE